MSGARVLNNTSSCRLTSCKTSSYAYWIETFLQKHKIISTKFYIYLNVGGIINTMSISYYYEMYIFNFLYIQIQTSHGIWLPEWKKCIEYGGHSKINTQKQLTKKKTHLLLPNLIALTRCCTSLISISVRLFRNTRAALSVIRIT